MEEKEVEIQGCITVSADVPMDTVIDSFIDWVEANGWSFGGGFREIRDGHYVRPDGTLGDSID